MKRRFRYNWKKQKWDEVYTVWLLPPMYINPWKYKLFNYRQE